MTEPEAEQSEVGDHLFDIGEVKAREKLRAEVVPLAEMEKHYILYVLGVFDGNRTHTAKALGIGTNTLWRKLTSYGVRPLRKYHPRRKKGARTPSNPTPGAP